MHLKTLGITLASVGLIGGSLLPAVAMADPINPPAAAPDNGQPDPARDGQWRYPFDNFDPNVNISSPFGMRDLYGQAQFHDGIDIDTDTNNDQDIKAIHGGTVYKIDHEGMTQNDLGYYICVKSDDGYYEIYQEFAFTPEEAAQAIKVHVGQHIHPGDTVAHLVQTDHVNHVHIGVTKTEAMEAQKSWETDDGTWLNPIQLIQDFQNQQAQQQNNPA